MTGTADIWVRSPQNVAGYRRGGLLADALPALLSSGAGRAGSITP